MGDDSILADDERAIELSSIAAIYPEMILGPDSPYQASLPISVSPAVPFKIRFQKLAASPASHLITPPISASDEDREILKHEESADVHHLAHLPSIDLKITLPRGYPTHRAPIFELSCSPAWIANDTLHKLTSDGIKLWEEQGRDQVIFTYIDHLQQSVEEGLDLPANAEHELILHGDLKIALLDFDLKAKRERFNKETFDCGICLEPKKGMVCHRLLVCSHVFCVDCLQECFNKCISEGDVGNVKCLDPGCGKEPKPSLSDRQANAARKKRRKHDPTLSPTELLSISLSEEQVQRYVHLKRKKKLESDKNVVYCPRPWCQGAARSKKYPKPTDPLHDFEEIPSDSEVEEKESPQTTSESKNMETIPMAKRLNVCEDCDYAFCSVCRKTWHGELISYRDCNPRPPDELSAEEKASADYIAMHSTPCPTCDVPSQKVMGCNHMICFKCGTHFCYLCSSYLMEDNPYQHYSNKDRPCYRRLWELEEGDNEHADVEVVNIPLLEENRDPDPDLGLVDIWYDLWPSDEEDPGQRRRRRQRPRRQ